ncbi:hypothetical protein E4U14_000767 [Claviceps sp. LM454 group G7]|nr:hypothetical protein E4U14_000767 [Claviceps sp. LM454 group G7]
MIASAEEANEAKSRRQHCEWKRLKKLEDDKLKRLKKEQNEKLKIEWRKHDKWDVNGDGKPKRIGFKRRKIWKGYEAADDVLSLHSEREPSPAPSEELYYYDTSRFAASQRFYERLQMPTVPSSDSVEIILDNSRGTPISEDHDDDTFPAIDEPLDSGDLDKQHAYDEALGELDLTQVDDGEEPDLPLLPPKSPPPLDRKEYPSMYHRLMDIMDDHRQKRRRTT